MMMPRTGKIETGIRSLDELLGGGFQVGALNLIYGEATSGKTTLLLTTVVNHLKNRKASKCIFIDTDNKLKLDRLTKIASFKDLKVLNRIKIFFPNNFQEQEETLEHLPRLNPFDIVILDSVTGLYRAETMGDETYKLNKLLNHQLGYMDEIAKISRACFLLTGQVRSVMDLNQIEPVAPRILSYWSSIIIKLQNSSLPRIRYIVLEKPHKTGNVILVKITDEGISEAEK
jgi:DNA repair protein RadB